MSGGVDNALFEGLFCVALDVSGELEAELKRLGYDRRNPEGAYDGAIFVACLDTVRRQRYADKTSAEGFHALGADFVRGFRETILGRVVTTALPILGPERFLPRLPGRFKSIRHDASAEVKLLGSNTAELTFTDALPVGHFFAGVVEAALRLAKAKDAHVDVKNATGGYVLYVSW